MLALLTALMRTLFVTILYLLALTLHTVMLCPRQGANCCYIDNVKLLQDLIKKSHCSIADSILVYILSSADTVQYLNSGFTPTLNNSQLVTV